MAQRVGYFEDNVTFTEGPFVMVNANGWRIEAEMDTDTPCNCVLPDYSIYQLRKHLGWPEGKTEYTDQAVEWVDTLNQMVRDGEIVKQGLSWVWPPGAYKREQS